jgi:HK97 family phage major capsid protein
MGKSMPTYNTGITRATPPTTDPLVPEPLSEDIIQELPSQSAILSMARKVPMSTRTQRLPVLDVLPQAYFVSGDSGLKQTTNLAWRNVSLVVEELAALVPIPDAYLSDTNIPLWDEVRPRLVEALGKAIDAACLFGTNKPSTWSPAIIPAAIAAGNVITDSSPDIPAAVASLAERVALDGYTNINGWLIRPGFKWRLLRVRSSGSGEPIYMPDLQNGRGGSLYGYPLQEVANGSWDPTVADMLLGDFSMAIVGMRQDITFKMFTEGVITDGAGAVVYNAMQQDGAVMRVVMRLAFATANPVTNLNSNISTRYPFGVLATGTSSAS